MSPFVRYTFKVRGSDRRAAMDAARPKIEAIGVVIDKEGESLGLLSGTGPAGLLDSLRAIPELGHAVIDRDATLA